MKKILSDKMLDESGKALMVQKHQMQGVERQLVKASQALTDLADLNDQNLSELEDLLGQAEALLASQGIDMASCTVEDLARGEALCALTEEEEACIEAPVFETLDTIRIDEGLAWQAYLEQIETYGMNHRMDLTRDPFEALLSEAEKAEIAQRIRSDYTMKKAQCDKYDYMIAAFCGVVAGLIDSFFVGMPEKSKLGNWTNEQTDSFVKKIAQLQGWKQKGDDEHSIANAIKFLEDRYKVNYDQATGKAANDLLGMSMKNHHIKSLGHAPDIVGLLFAIVDQFTSTSHFLDNGRLIVFDTQTTSLRGGNFVAKLYCGLSNWLGHLISDVAGSSSGRRNNPDGYGSGIPMPFFELFQMCDKGAFKVDGAELSLADLSVKVFENHYDARFGMAQAIPVAINEVAIRLLWAIKARVYAKKPWKECIPIGSHPELRRMLLTGHGVLCLVDSMDAAIRAQGQVLLFALHLNFEAWKRLAFAGLMEVRALYKENALDLAVMEKDLEIEWNRLYQQSM